MITSKVRLFFKKFKLLNYDQWFRYKSICDLLKYLHLENHRILDIGGSFVEKGNFQNYFSVNKDYLAMPDLLANAWNLPFKDDSWDIVICVDTLEHIPSSKRQLVLNEILRVSKNFLIIAFPSGFKAIMADREMYNFFISRSLRPPAWLKEHQKYGLPYLKEVIERLKKQAEILLVIPNYQIDTYYRICKVTYLKQPFRIIRLFLTRLILPIISYKQDLMTTENYRFVIVAKKRRKEN